MGEILNAAAMPMLVVIYLILRLYTTKRFLKATKKLKENEEIE